MDDVSRGEKKEPEARMKVWRPEGFAGVEVTQIEHVYLYQPPSVIVQNYDFVINRKFGRCKVDYGKRRYSYRPSRNLVWLQQPGEVFSAEPLDDSPLYSEWISLSPSYIKQLLADLGNAETKFYIPYMQPSLPFNNSLARLIQEAIGAFEHPTHTIERESRLLGLVYAVLKHCADTQPPETKLGKEHKAVSLVKEAFQAHPGQDHTLADLSVLTGLNQKYLLGVFKEEVGLPLRQYLTSLRVQRAKDRLAKGEAVAAVAHSLGFYDQAHFTKVFKKHVRGVTPGKFRHDTLNAT